jgi:cytochrome P450
VSNPTISLADIDLSDPDEFVAGVPYEAFALLRREDPVHFNPEPDGPGFWAVTRYEDIRAIHRDPATFSSELGGITLEDLSQDELEARKSMIDLDPPRHDELRAIVNRRFTPRAVTVWEDLIRGVATEVLDKALPLGEFDYVDEVSSVIPMRVFGEIMGIPQDERRDIVRLGNQLVGRQDPEYGVGPEHEDQTLPFSSPAALGIFEIGRRLAGARREEPRDDLVTQLVSSALTDHEFDLFFLLLAVAGNETTRHTLSFGLLALLEYPDQLDRLRQDPALLKTAAEEMLRWASPVNYFRRTATRDVELHGRRIAAGDKVTTWFVSGNRDDEVFTDPNTFDVGRSPNPHMAFGPGGIHLCLGAHLARLEIRIVFEELLARQVEFELAGPVERLRSNLGNGIKRLPVRVLSRTR